MLKDKNGILENKQKDSTITIFVAGETKEFNRQNEMLKWTVQKHLKPEKKIDNGVSYYKYMESYHTSYKENFYEVEIRTKNSKEL